MILKFHWFYIEVSQKSQLNLGMLPIITRKIYRMSDTYTIKLDLLLQMSARLSSMMDFEGLDYYTRWQRKRDVVVEQEKMNRMIGQYKRKMKDRYYYDDFMVLVIDCLF